MFRDAEIIKAIGELAKRLDAVEALLAAEITWKKVAEERLEENRELRDRLMARDFQDYAVGRPAAEFEVVIPPELEPDEDEDNAGRIVL